MLSIAAVHALGAVFDDSAADVLSDLLSAPQLYLREHAAWALGSRNPRFDAVVRLLAGVVVGGFSTVINQRALRRWAQAAPEHIALAVEGALLAQDNPAARARLVETLGLVPGAVATRPGAGRERCNGAGAGPDGGDLGSRRPRGGSEDRRHGAATGEGWRRVGGGGAVGRVRSRRYPARRHSMNNGQG